MANLFDYLDWRGDLPFSQSPFCDIDALIFSRLAYLPFDGIVDNTHRTCTLPNAAQQLLSSPEALSRIRNPQDLQLLKRIPLTPRFCEIRLSHFRSRLDAQHAEQFCAICLHIDGGTRFLAFRGTDNTLAGWKEDFNMSFLSPVPGQLDALAYMMEIAGEGSAQLYLGGHSKGGNLAVYAAAFAPPPVQARICRVFNHDGPGFPSDVLTSPGYTALGKKLRAIIPQSSIVGMLLEHEDNYTIIRSTQAGIFQHDVYSWQVLGNHFICLDTVTNSSRFFDHTIRQWLSEMTPAQREMLVNTIFDTIGGNAQTLSELTSNAGHTIRRIVHSLRGLEPEQQRMVAANLGRLWHAARENFSVFLPHKPEKPDDAS